MKSMNQLNETQSGDRMETITCSKSVTMFLYVVERIWLLCGKEITAKIKRIFKKLIYFIERLFNN